MSAKGPAPSVRLILIRHGETAWTRERRFQGRMDLPLTLKGRRSSLELAQILKTKNIDCVYTSALKRARETGRIIARTIKRKIRRDPRLNEISFGVWEGKTAIELLASKDAAFQSWCRGRFKTPVGGERFQSFKQRTTSFLNELKQRHRNRTIAVVSHGGTIKMMLCLLFHLPFHFFSTFRVDPASISEIEI